MELIRHQSELIIHLTFVAFLFPQIVMISVLYITCVSVQGFVGVCLCERGCVCVCVCGVCVCVCFVCVCVCVCVCVHVTV